MFLFYHHCFDFFVFFFDWKYHRPWATLIDYFHNTENIKIDNQLNLWWPNNLGEKTTEKKMRIKTKLETSPRCLIPSSVANAAAAFRARPVPVSSSPFVFADITQPANYWSANADTTTTCLWQDQSQCTTRQERLEEEEDDCIAVDERSTEFYKRVGVVVVVACIYYILVGLTDDFRVLIFTLGERRKEKEKERERERERVWRLWSQLLFHSTRNQLACVSFVVFLLCGATDLFLFFSFL